MEEFWGFYPVDADGQIIVCCDDAEDREDAAPIALELRKLGVPVWYDCKPARGAKRRTKRIEEQLRRANALVLYISDYTGMFFEPDSAEMPEYRKAKALGVPVIPVLSGKRMFEEDFLKTWAEDCPEAFEKNSAEFKKILRSDFARCSDDDSPQSTAAKLEHLLSSKNLYTHTAFADDPVEVRRKTEKAEDRQHRAMRRFRASRRFCGFPFKLLAFVVSAVSVLLLLCFSEELSGCINERIVTHPEAYYAEQADEALGVTEPLYFDSGSSHFPLGSINNCLIIVHHYGFFRNDRGKDCILLEFNYTGLTGPSDIPVFFSRAVQDNRSLINSTGDYIGYRFAGSPGKLFTVFEGVDLSGGDVSICIQYIASGSDTLSEINFACPIPDPETDVVSG